MSSKAEKNLFGIVVCMLCFGIGILFAQLIIQNTMETSGGAELKVIDEFELKDMVLEGNVFTSLSQDSWIVKKFAKGTSFKTITIDVEEMNVESCNIMILYDSEDYISGNNYIVGKLSPGENIYNIPNSTEIKTLRIDLTDENNIAININGIYIGQ